MKYEVAARAIKYSLKKETKLHGETLLKVPSEEDIRHRHGLWNALGVEALQKWKNDWERCQTGAWTRKLIKEPGKVAIEPCFWLGQALSGHGAYGSYLFKMKRRNTPECLCGVEEQTPEHVFEYCPKYEENRPDTLEVEDTAMQKYMLNMVKKLWEDERRGIRKRNGGEPDEDQGNPVGEPDQEEEANPARDG